MLEVFIFRHVFLQRFSLEITIEYSSGSHDSIGRIIYEGLTNNRLLLNILKRLSLRHKISSYRHRYYFFSVSFVDVQFHSVPSPFLAWSYFISFHASSAFPKHPTRIGGEATRATGIVSFTRQIAFVLSRLLFFLSSLIDDEMHASGRFYSLSPRICVYTRIAHPLLPQDTLRVFPPACLRYMRTYRIYVTKKARLAAYLGRNLVRRAFSFRLAGIR